MIHFSQFSYPFLYPAIFSFSYSLWLQYLEVAYLVVVLAGGGHIYNAVRISKALLVISIDNMEWDQEVQLVASHRQGRQSSLSPMPQPWKDDLEVS